MRQAGRRQSACASLWQVLEQDAQRVVDAFVHLLKNSPDIVSTRKELLMSLRQIAGSSVKVCACVRMSRAQRARCTHARPWPAGSAAEPLG